VRCYNVRTRLVFGIMLSSSIAASAFLKFSSSNGAAAGTVLASSVLQNLTEHGTNASTTHLAPFEVSSQIPKFAHRPCVLDLEHFKELLQAAKDEIINACCDMPLSDSAVESTKVMTAVVFPTPTPVSSSNDSKNDGWIAFLGLEGTSQAVAEFTNRYLACSLRGNTTSTKHIRLCGSSFAGSGQTAPLSFQGQHRPNSSSEELGLPDTGATSSSTFLAE
jgi:hypothetical protein